MTWDIGRSGSCRRTGLYYRWSQKISDTSLPLTEIPWGNLRLPFVPHSLQCGGGRRDPALGDGGGANVDRSRGTQGDYLGVGGILLHV